ncbi:4-alpha-glucanotransferase [Moorella thermoacetica]|uniref:4-alpha-glucanotransferase n=1 Tax=Neomoorella thermoacetica TaxID=1525 RepID=UPI0008FB90E8|nr:4-alpha-glucanotransferase [Moorella thermoacetica]OIQ62811.1 4-alpha-glucanotransferase [Moorella thermoacetica]
MRTLSDKELRLLHRLCRWYGVEPAYRDGEGKLRRAGPESLLAVLRALGAPVAGLADLPGALRERRQQYWRRCCEPVAVAWAGRLSRMELRLPAGRATGPLECRLRLEDGRVWRMVIDPGSLPLLRTTVVEGVAFEARQLTFPARLPWGYHHLHLHLPGLTREVLLIAAPSRAGAPLTGRGEHLWGCFLPLYALHSHRSLGAGDFGDLEALSLWVNSMGGSFTGTLPFLAAFLDEPFAPSPYQPVSRLFWNEFYLDISRLEEVQQCREARDFLNSAAVQKEIAALRAAPLVDYRRGMALKRRLLALCARTFFTGAPGRREEMAAWLAGNPAARDYARFRAAVEKQHATWPEWPAPMRDGNLGEGDYDPEAMQYHLYVQWQAHRQVQALAARARRSGPGLYLDLPLGVHREGYDVWRHRRAFALAASSGAPPDALFRRGQDWGFPPFHPEGIREDGYHYYIACLRHHLRHAGILRLDHVMGLHHLYWIPRGLAATEGVYVRYHAGEFYAILSLESRRHGALLVGEDLGTVPAYVRRAMTRHNISRMYILAVEYTGKTGRALGPVPPESLAGLNTHDMPPFAAFWRERKKNSRQLAALPVFLYNRGRLEVPTTATRSLLRGCLAHLAASPARLLLVNLEDLWLETEPQNIPGTSTEYPNWRRKARYSLEEFSRQPGVVALLREVNYWRGTAK